MIAEINGKKCAACGAYLFDEDEVVFCPVCGAPHHRDCYNNIGKCAFESLHGTDRQYDKALLVKEAENIKKEPKIITKPKDTGLSVKCTACGNEYSISSESCPNCGAPNVVKISPFDTLGGIPEDLDLGNGVTAGEARQFVFSNSQRYIPKFAAAKYGKKASWNWFSFLFPCIWFLSRKMYKLGALAGAITIALSMLTLPFMAEFEQFFVAGENVNYTLLIKTLTDNIQNFNKSAMIVFIISWAVTFLLSLLCGIFGDYVYRNHTISSISQIKSKGDEIFDEIRRKGGISFIAMIIGFFAVEYLPAIIYGFTL